MIDAGASTWTVSHLKGSARIEAEDEAARDRLNRQVLAYRTHHDADELVCSCGANLPPGSASDKCRACYNRDWMREARANRKLSRGRQQPDMHPCEACGTPIRKWVNSNFHRFCGNCRGKSLAWRQAAVAMRARVSP